MYFNPMVWYELVTILKMCFYDKQTRAAYPENVMLVLRPLDLSIQTENVL